MPLRPTRPAEPATLPLSSHDTTTTTRTRPDIPITPTRLAAPSRPTRTVPRRRQAPSTVEAAPALTASGFDDHPIISAAHLRIKIFADGADLAGITRLACDPLVRGFTTNPTLMRKANVHDYERFARDVLACVTDRPVSFEVFSDDFAEMERQAKLIASWASNVNVKIPVTNSAGLTSEHLMRRLASEGVPMNITAVTTLRQVEACAQSLRNGPASIISLFAGRVADTGRDPVPLMTRALQLIRPFNNLELLWASPREIFNVVQADAIGCDIITVTHELLSKLNRLGTDPAAVSLETVRMFADDARHSGYRL